MSIRTERVARIIQRTVADLLQNEFANVTSSMVTVTDVRVTRDLSIAYLYVSIYGDEGTPSSDVMARLEEAKPQIRFALGNRIRHQMRKVPGLQFFLDESHQKAARIDELLRQAAPPDDSVGEEE